MHILISNDDGIHAPGIIALAKMLEGHGDISIVAPNTERSAASHSLTLGAPLRAIPVDFPVENKCAYAVNGTPSDCVKVALSSLLHCPPDLILSGINNGANLAVDVFYSGTVAAALEGSFHKIPSMAISFAAHSMQYDLLQQKDIILEAIALRMKHKGMDSTLFNLNLPPIPRANIKGIKITRMGKTEYSDQYEKRTDPQGKPYYWLKGTLTNIDESHDTDLVAVRHGYASLTPLFPELTDMQGLTILNTK